MAKISRSGKTLYSVSRILGYSTRCAQDVHRGCTGEAKWRDTHVCTCPCHEPRRALLANHTTV